MKEGEEPMEKESKPCWVDSETKICSFWGEIHGGDFCHLHNEELTEEGIEKGCPECQY